jgi:hypothetical protein
MNPLPDGWILVKDPSDKIYWVNQELEEISEDPPNLNELIENFHRVKKKSQMMAKRDDEDKQNARKKILGRNLVSEDQPQTEAMVPVKPPGRDNQKKNNADLLEKSKNEKSFPKNSDAKKNVSSGHRKLPSFDLENDVFLSEEKGVNGYTNQQTTDKKFKDGVMNQSDEILDKLAEEDSVENDLFKYTKSTMKKNGDPSGRKAEGVYNNLFNDELNLEEDEENANDQAIMELDLNDDEDEKIVDFNFTTPSIKKVNQGNKKDTILVEDNPVIPKHVKNRTENKGTKQQAQMIDSTLLEKIIGDIGEMQMKLSHVEMENENLKRKNVDLLKEQRKMKEQTTANLRKQKEEIEELKKDRDESAHPEPNANNLNIMKDMAAIKELLQNSVLKQPLQTPNFNRALDNQLPLVDSQVINVNDPNVFHQSFGIGQQPFGNLSNQSKEAMAYASNPPKFPEISNPYSMKNPVVTNESRTQNNSSKMAKNLPPPEIQNIILSSTGIMSKWMKIILNERETVKLVKNKLQNEKTALKKKKYSIKNYELEMNKEISSMSLDKSHSLISKIKKNIRSQVKQYVEQENKWKSDCNKLTARIQNIDLLERTLMYANNLGPITEETDRHLTDIFNSFNQADANETFSKNMGDSSMDSGSRNQDELKSSHNSSEAQDEGQSQEKRPEDGPAPNFSKKEGAVELDETDRIRNEPMQPVLAETVHIKQSKSKPESRGSRKSRGSSQNYFNEFDKVKERGTSYVQNNWGSDYFGSDLSNLRRSVGYYIGNKYGNPEEMSAMNLRRYFENQSKWYSNVRNEVRQELLGAEYCFELPAWRNGVYLLN